MTLQDAPLLKSKCRSRSCATDEKKMSDSVLISISGARFHTLQDDGDDRIGQGGQIVGVAVVLRQDPGGDDLIERAEEAVGGHGNGDVGAKGAGFLAFADHAFDQIKILHQQVVRELPEKLQAVAELGLKDDGQLAVVAKAVEMQVGDAAQLFPRLGHVFQRTPGALNEAVESGVNGCHQQLVFVLEIKIDGAVGHPGAVGDLGDAGVEKAVLGDNLNGSVENALVLVRGAVRRLG